MNPPGPDFFIFVRRFFFIITISVSSFVMGLCRFLVSFFKFNFNALDESSSPSISKFSYLMKSNINDQS